MKYCCILYMFYPILNLTHVKKYHHHNMYHRFTIILMEDV